MLAAVAACGDDSKKATEPTPVPNDEGTVEGSAPSSGIAHPTGAQDVVLKLSYEGGFVPVGTTFVNTPALLVSGDGHVYTPAVIPAIFPGPLLPSMLGADNPESPPRQALLGAVNIITDVAAAVGEASLGQDQPFVADKYRFQARVVDQAELDSQQPAPTIVEWPGLTTLPLSSAATCAVIDAAAVGSLFVDAKQNTYFKDGDIVYQLAAAGVLPGDPDC